MFKKIFKFSCIIGAGYLTLGFLFNTVYAYVGVNKVNESLCKQLKEKISGISNYVSYIYEDNSLVYNTFATDTITWDDREAHDAILKRLTNVYRVSQQIQAELQNIYVLVCTDPNKVYKLGRSILDTL